MNTIGPGLIDAVTLGGLLSDIRSLVSDPEASVSATLAIPTAISNDLAAGTTSRTEHTATVDAYFAPLTLQEITASEGVYQTGDRRLIVDASVLSLAPSTATRVTIEPADQAWEVIQAEQDSINAAWHLICRRST